MKVRNGFVSNSSSASFIIPLECLTKKQIEKIKNHLFHAKRMSLNVDYTDGHFGYFNDDYDAWEISERDNDIHGYTSMDNFNMYNFLEAIGIDMEKVEFTKD